MGRRQSPTHLFYTTFQVVSGLQDVCGDQEDFQLGRPAPNSPRHNTPSKTISNSCNVPRAWWHHALQASTGYAAVTHRGGSSFASTDQSGRCPAPAGLPAMPPQAGQIGLALLAAHSHTSGLSRSHHARLPCPLGESC